MSLQRQPGNFMIREGIVIETMENDRIKVLDQYSDVTLSPCKIVRSPGTASTDYVVGTEVLVLEINYKYYALGSVITRDVPLKTEDGESVFFLGENRALIGYADGTCGIYNCYQRTDGSYVSNPLLMFDNQGNLSIVANDYSLSSGSVYSESVELNDILFVEKKERFRSSSNDVMPRQIHDVKGTVTGISDKKVTSLLPSPANPMLLPVETMAITPLTLVEETTALTPKKITYLIAPGVEAVIEIDLSGTVSIKTPAAKISCSVIGQITISSTVLGEINISPLGTISIDGKAGVDIKGTTISLLDTLFDLVTEISTMTVPTGVGPSGPPLTSPKFLAIAAKLKAIKGGA